MSDGDGEMSVPPRRRIPHYHGDEAQALFFGAAVVLIVAQSTGADLPLSTMGTVFTSVLLVIVAGITNPAAKSIHWINGFLSVCGVLLFGTSAVTHYRAGISIIDPSFIYTEVLALLSLVALYYTTRTIRGIMQRPTLE